MAYVQIHLTVEDYDEWKKHFNDDELNRKAGGGISSEIYRNASAPEEIMLLMEWEDPGAASTYVHTMAHSDNLQKAGIITRPIVTFYKKEDS